VVGNIEALDSREQFQMYELISEENCYMLTNKPATSRAVIPRMSPLVAKWFLLVRAIT